MQQNQFQMLKQILNTPNKEQALINMLGGNSEALNMFNQLKNMSKEAQANQIANMCNKLGINKEQYLSLFK